MPNESKHGVYEFLYMDVLPSCITASKRLCSHEMTSLVEKQFTAAGFCGQNY